MKLYIILAVAIFFFFFYVLFYINIKELTIVYNSALIQLGLNTESKHWAFIFAGSQGWDNYRHQVKCWRYCTFVPPPRVRVRATVKLSAAFFHDESSITIGGGYESAIAPKCFTPLKIQDKNKMKRKSS